MEATETTSQRVDETTSQRVDETTSERVDETTGGAWLPAALTASPQVHARLLANPNARVLIVFCGGGAPALELARAYPGVRIDALDLDDGAVAAARRSAARAGVDERVRFDVHGPGALVPTTAYDLVLVTGCGPRGDPVAVLLDPGGSPR